MVFEAKQVEALGCEPSQSGSSPDNHPNTVVLQSAERAGSNPVKCEFESRGRYQIKS